MSDRLTGWASARTRRAGLALLTAALTTLASPVAQAFNPDTLTPSSISLQGVTYYGSPVFADAVKMSRSWETGPTGAKYTINPGHNKLNAVGLPTASSTTEVFTSWYQSTSGEKALLNGRWVVSWTGVGNVTLTGTGVTFVSGTAAGASNGGRRVYTYSGTSRPTIQMTGLNSSGLSSLNVWMPHPSAPNTYSLEPAERAAYNAANGIAEHADAVHFSPVLVKILKERPWSAIRFMDWMATNNNPSQNWSERRGPGYATQANGLVSRNSTTGVSPHLDADGNTVWSNPGIAWEYAVALCNATGKNLWITVPHLSVKSIGTADDYNTNLAKVIAYGSDANGQPYASTHTGTKVWKPLDANLEVFVEYSNEVWNPQFTQRAFNENECADTNVPQQVAINSLKVWTAFETVPALKSGTVDRVVRLLGCQQVSGGNLKSSLDELYATGKDGLASHADAVTTASYFGNSIEAFVRDAILEGERHPLAHQKDASQPGGQYPVYTYSTAAQGRITAAYLDKAFDEWTRRVLNGDSNAGNAFDSTGKIGGIEQGVYDAAAARGLRIVATEGGASIYTDKFDNGSPYDDLLTNFVAEFPEQTRMAELLKVHLEFGRMRGLRSYNIFTLTGEASKFGQWGVLNLNGQQETEAYATKYRAVREWFDEVGAMRHVGLPVGTAPSFTTAEDLGEFRVGTAISLPIATTNATSLKVISKILVPGLGVSVSGTSATISGNPSKPGLNYVLLRALDNDKDPAWRVFKFNVKHWSQNNYFNDLATTATPIANFVYNSRYVFSSEDGGASLLIDPITAGSGNKVVRLVSAAPLNVEYNSGVDPLNNQPFNFDTVKLGRGNTTVVGARVEGLSEAGNVIVAEDIALSGGVNTVAEFVRNASWKNLFSVKITFYSARVYNSTTKVYDITPAAGGIVDEFKVNL